MNCTRVQFSLHIFPLALTLQEGEVDPGLLGFVMQTTGNFLVGSKVLSSAVMLPDLLLLATNSKYIR